MLTENDLKKEVDVNMERSIDDLVKILLAGGGLVLDAGKMSTDDLLKLADASVESDESVTLRNVSDKSTEELANIATQGEGNIVFEF